MSVSKARYALDRKRVFTISPNTAGQIGAKLSYSFELDKEINLILFQFWKIDERKLIANAALLWI